jgi:glycerol-3-phosphate dehydrogenase
MSICVAVVGAGRMGTVVAKQLPKDTRKIIIDIDMEKAGRLAQIVAGIASCNLQDAEPADLVAVVLPTPVVNKTVDTLLGVVNERAVIVNMATTAHIDTAILNKNETKSVIDAKIIGHAMSIFRGEPGIVVVDCSDTHLFNFIKQLLPGFHKVVQGDACLVEKINKIGSTEGIRAAVAVHKQLVALGIPDEWIDVAIRTVCAGTMKSYTENDLGHFALELVKKLEKDLD